MAKLKYNIIVNKKSANCHIEDSYKVTNDDIKIDFVVNVMFKKAEIFSKRSVESYVWEWKAHNILYGMNLFRKSTKDADLDTKENIFRRIGYWIISHIFKEREIYE